MVQQGAQGLAQNLPPPPGGVVPPPMGMPQAGAYLVQAQVVTNPNLSEEDTIRQVLHWINFCMDVNKDAIINDGLESFSDVRVMTEKDINTMATSFASHTVLNDRTHFSTRRMKYLKSCTQWIRDFYQVVGVPTIVGLTEESFKPQLDQAAARAVVRKSDRNIGGGARK